MKVRSNYTLTEEQHEWLRYQAYKRRSSKSAIVQELINKAKIVEQVASENMEMIKHAEKKQRQLRT